MLPKVNAECLQITFQFSVQFFLSLGYLVMTFKEENKINHWPTPAESPDLNPTEMLWHELNHYLRAVVEPSNNEELRSVANTYTIIPAQGCSCSYHMGEKSIYILYPTHPQNGSLGATK